MWFLVQFNGGVVKLLFNLGHGYVITYITLCGSTFFSISRNQLELVNIILINKIVPRLFNLNLLQSAINLASHYRYIIGSGSICQHSFPSTKPCNQLIDEFPQCGYVFVRQKGCVQILRTSVVNTWCGYRDSYQGPISESSKWHYI